MSGILELRDLRKSFGATEIIRGVDLSLAAGERHALIGPNGAGKSTLFNLVSGRHPATSGAVLLKGRDITRAAPQTIRRAGLARSFQITSLFPRLSVIDNLRCALLWPLGYGYSFWQRLTRARDVNEQAEAMLRRLSLTSRRDTPAGLLSYAEQRALEIGLTVAGGADVILLDEPTAGMSRAETAQAVALIRELTAGKTLLMVEHDMNVVFGLADRISVLVYGRIIATGSPEAIRANPEVRAAYLGSAAESEPA